MAARTSKAKEPKTTKQEETPVKKTTTRTPKVKIANEGSTLAQAVTKKVTGLSVEVVDQTGKVTETIELPGAIFGAKINKPLMAQAVRVYLANQRAGSAHTKSRGEVHGSSRKIYRQKGTGRARHGGIRAPIFVGGGVALGPKSQDHSLSLPQKMRRAALFSALTAKHTGGSIRVIDGLEKLEPKTKSFVEVLKKLSLDAEKKKILVVLPAKMENVQKAARNVEGVTYVFANQLNTYEVLNTKTMLMTKDAVPTLEKTYLKGAQE